MDNPENTKTRAQLGTPPIGMEDAAALASALLADLGQVSDDLCLALTQMNPAVEGMPVRYAGLRGQLEAMLTAQDRVRHHYYNLVNPEGNTQ